jgi:hypothetical protein
MESVLAIYYLCIDIYIVSTLLYETFTPFHLGLAVQLYHEFGSRGLVDNLNSHGFCSSYSEVRRFLTSVALKEEESIKEGVYVPDGIVPVCQGGCLIQEGADNIDINTEIIDGKDTFLRTVGITFVKKHH